MNPIFYENVSWCIDLHNPGNIQISPIDALLESIRVGGKSGSIADKIARLRNEPDESKRKQIKTTLPVILWQGVFSMRKKGGLQRLSSVMCIDIDHLSPEEQMRLKYELSCAQWVMAIFNSPSGDGLKILVKTNVYEPKIYENCYRQLRVLIENDYSCQTDDKCENYGQGCFASYDPDIRVNWDVVDLHLSYDPAYDIKLKNPQPSVNPLSNFNPAQPSKVDTFLNKLTSLQQGLSDEQILNILDRKFRRYPQNYTDGHRTKSIFIQASTLCKAGVDFNLALQYLEEQFLPTGYDLTKLQYEVYNAYEKCSASFGNERGSYLSYGNFKQLKGMK